MALRGGRGDYRGVGGEPYLLQDRFFLSTRGSISFLCFFLFFAGKQVTSKKQANGKQKESKQQANRKQNESKTKARCMASHGGMVGSDGKRKTSPLDGRFVQDVYLWAVIHGSRPRGFGDFAEIGSPHGVSRRAGDKRRRGACRAEGWSKAEADHKQDGSKLQASYKQVASKTEANSKQTESRTKAKSKQTESKKKAPSNHAGCCLLYALLSFDDIEDPLVAALDLLLGQAIEAIVVLPLI